MAGTNNSHNLHISLSQCISIRAHFVLYHPIITFSLVNIVFWPPIPYSTSATPPPSPVQPREVLPKECSSHCLGTLYKVSRQPFRLYNSLFSQKRIGKKCIKTSATNLLHGGVHRPAATMGGGECSLPTLYSRLDIVVPSFAYRILSIYRLNRFVMSTFYILADHHRS